MTFLTTYALYRVTEDPTVSVDLGFGARVMDLDVDADLSPGQLAGQSFGIGDTYVDPLVAGRLRLQFSEEVFGAVIADYALGGGGTDETWQVTATIGYRLNDRWTLQGGYRQLDVQTAVGGREVEVRMSGPVFGATFRF